MIRIEGEIFVQLAGLGNSLQWLYFSKPIWKQICILQKWNARL